MTLIMTLHVGLVTMSRAHQSCNPSNVTLDHKQLQTPSNITAYHIIVATKLNGGQSCMRGAHAHALAHESPHQHVYANIRSYHQPAKKSYSVAQVRKIRKHDLFQTHINPTISKQNAATVQSSQGTLPIDVAPSGLYCQMHSAW